MRRLATLSVACALGLMATAPEPARADDEPDQSAKQRALELLQDGNRFYDAGEYGRAIAVYREAYDVTGAPGFLFSLGQAYRLSGDCKSALRHYKRFLGAVPETDKRRLVERFIERAEAECPEASAPEEPGRSASGGEAGRAGSADVDPGAGNALRQRAPAAPSPATAHGAAATSGGGADDGVRDPRPSSGLRIAGIATASIGLVALGAGTYYALDARSKSNELSSFTGTWGPEQIELESSGARSESRAIVLAAAGGVAVIGGVVLAVFARPVDEDAGTTSVAVAPVRGGGLVTFSGGF